MKYEKPGVVALEVALKAIESGGGKPSTIQVDSLDPRLSMTNGAYEADE